MDALSRSARNDLSKDKDKLVRDMRAVVSDAEDLLRATAGQAGDKVVAARERIQANLTTAKEQLAAVQDDVIARTRQAADATDQYVHENPWRAAGIAAGIAGGVGLLVGMLISRGR